MRHKIQKPDFRENGEYQFVVGYTSWGNPECQHVSAEKIAERCRAQVGDGKLVDDGEDLWWEQPDPITEVIMAKATYETWITFRGIPEVLVIYEDGGYEPDTNAHEIIWWFAEDNPAEMRTAEVTAEEDATILTRLYALSQERSMFDD